MSVSGKKSKYRVRLFKISRQFVKLRAKGKGNSPVGDIVPVEKITKLTMAY
jgi:hypothetical protein